MDLDKAQSEVVSLVTEAGKLLMENLTKVKRASFKAKSDIVTDIDVQAEKIIIAGLKKSYPNHGIHSEESGLHESSSKYHWLMDPIDGTINYYHASPPFRIGVCLLKDEEPVMTVILNPVKNELYAAQKGKGATLNGQRITVNANSDLQYSVVMTHISSQKDARARTILALDSIFKKTLHMRIFGSGLAALSYVASGKFDVYFNVHTYPWDILPGALLVQEAGGLVTDIEGHRLTYESSSIVATNGNVHQNMLELLKDI